jgi:small subunit ribosomal protein S9
VSAGEGQKDTVTDSPVTDSPVTDSPVTDSPVTDSPGTGSNVTGSTVEAKATVAGAVVEMPPAAPAPKTPRSVPRTERPIQTVGRRKEAIVRVRILPGSGNFTLNGRSLEAYFPSKVHQQVVREPLAVSERLETLDVIANLRGGGVTGQAGALRLAIARALCELDVDDRPALKKAGFLTRDSREKESKKYGLKKARKAPQYSKR